MRTAGGVLGIIGSIAGFFLAGLAFFIGVVGVAASKAANDAISQAQADPTVVAASGGQQQLAQTAKDISDASGSFAWAAGGAGILGILCVVGLIGGIMAFFKPPVGAIMMAVAGVGGFVVLLTYWAFWSFSGFFLLLGAVLAFLGTFQKTAPQTQMQPAGAPGYYPPQQAYPQQGYYPQQQDYRQPQAYPQSQVYQQPQQPYYPQPQPQQGFPPAPQYGQPNPQPQQAYYPQPQQPQQGFPPAAPGSQQQFNPQPTTAPDGRQVVPPQDNTRLN